MRQGTRFLGLCLALLATTALAEPVAPPDAHFDTVLSPARPLSAEEALRETPPAQPYDKPTYTYLRCYYRVSNDPNIAATDYVWARDPAANDYYRLHGVWRNGGLLPWQSMFYSAATQQALRDICRQTLASTAAGREPAMVAAANNALSYNHAVWTLADTAPGDGVERLIAFGDSLSDIQNMYAISQWKAPQNPTWFLGRFSNGPVWVERLASALDLPLYDWAIGGAAGHREIILPGLRQQIASWLTYTRDDPAYRPERTLFTLWVGGNDLISYHRTPARVVDDMQASLQQLIAHGARRLLVLNLPDLGRAPIAQARGLSAKLTAQTDMYNGLLATMVSTLQQTYGAAVSLQLFDTHALFNDIIAHPANYQIDNISDNCLAIKPASKLPWPYLLRHASSPACANADRYLFWDPLHPTARTHAILAEHVIALLRAPSPHGR